MPRKIDPTIKRKPDTGVLKSEMQEQHRRDIVALEAAKEMEIANADIAACGHATCPSREHCLRWVIGQRLEEYTRFGSFTPKDGKCKYYIWTQERSNPFQSCKNWKEL